MSNPLVLELQRRARSQWDALEQSAWPRILVGTATCGRSAGALDVLEALRAALRTRGVQAHLIEVGCLGLCYAEPIVMVAKRGWPMIAYGPLTPSKAAALVDRFVMADDPLPEYALGALGEPAVPGVPRLAETPVWKHQVRRTLAWCGLIDPTNIDHYLAHGGYSGLARALELGPDGVIEELKAAGLRGRGGAGFPTWRKWRLARDTPAPVKYIVCNGSEGDPGVFSNKLLLESDPHLVLEGSLIAAYAVGAAEVYLYCPWEYTLALDRIGIAVEQVRASGLVGEASSPGGVAVHLKIKAGAGAYVCGEESALIECIEGQRGLPRARPPFPPVCGLWGRPTIVNNVETLACVSLILRHGASWFGELGTEASRGTKLVCLSGNVRRGGVMELPFGTPLGQIVRDIGGGTADGQPVKAVLVGGPGGGCLPPEHFDLPLDQDALIPFGASLGSGGVIVLDPGACPVNLARNYLEFAVRESCGRCAPCRLGTHQMLQIVSDLGEGRGQAGDWELLAEIARALKTSALCGLGQTVANPLLAFLRYFRAECDAHVAGSCPAGVCPMQRAADPPHPASLAPGPGQRD